MAKKSKTIKELDAELKDLVKVVENLKEQHRDGKKHLSPLFFNPPLRSL